MIHEQYTQTAKKWIARATSRRPSAMVCLVAISLIAFIASALAPFSRLNGSNDLQESAACIIESTEAMPRTAVSHYMLALLNMQIEDYPQAKYELRQALKMDPDGKFAGGIEAANELDKEINKKIMRAKYATWLLYAAIVGILLVIAVVARRKLK
jgi:tetratricopeptide (TPR) repeat protein